MVEQLDYKDLFQRMHPGFFEDEDRKRMPPDDICEEMILTLSGFQVDAFELAHPDNVAFGYYSGDREELLRAVGTVESGWPPYFKKGDPVYCGFADGKIASFCLVEDMGSHVLGGRKLKIGGPGCVGTLPEYRRRGIGLKMVADVTEILRQKGYDYSYIHYTGVAHWYAKLGYETVLKWNGQGFC